ncbi:2-dehydropantoate 2-reductase [Dethiosulfatibacter aminovorans DSM 17477]|uniref:2-dehydropantoate 2-reductase n=1 Tax=Dethiosulfatibacter aminovorans DSM 17477 TaxID=1121476 RepID=A0A1M6JXP3_9FIRM|nr:ketopantoate reductase family protein [Dethiosulfatibacter aminovorans]SHJ51474.1 2-dehydropantoate 2-reductase [Dethiosulfatibacter aminovorans DSM 17477]
MIKKIAIIGLGAIGASVGEQIIGKGYDVKIVADRNRIERYEETGIYVNDEKIDFEYLTPEDGEVMDLIIVCTKFHDLENTVRDMENLVGENTIIISLLNGIDSEMIIGEAYGMDKLIYSYINKISGVKEGNRINRGAKGIIHIGSVSDMDDLKVREIAELLDNCGVQYIVEENIIKSLWWKLMLNVGVNQLAAVSGATYGVVVEFQEARNMMGAAMMEVVKISQVMGTGLTEDDMNSCFSNFDNLPYGGKPSMLQDVENKRKTEVEMFAGRIIELGKKCSIPTPVNEFLYNAIRLIEKRY